MFEPELSIHFVEPRLLEHAVGRCFGQSFPKQAHCVTRFLASARRQAMREHNGIDGASALRTDALKGQPLFLEKTIEHAPSKRTVAAASLQCQVDDLLSGHSDPPGVRIVNWLIYKIH